MQRKQQYALGASILVIMLLALGVWRANRPSSMSNDGGKNDIKQIQDRSAQGGSGAAPSQTPTPSPTPTKVATKLNYGDAIQKYPYRIQFINCGGKPGLISVKRNTPIMLDNRDNKKHTIKVAGKTYSLAAYDYALAYIGTEGTYNLTCDGGGAATVNIEK